MNIINRTCRTWFCVLAFLALCSCGVENNEKLGGENSGTESGIFEKFKYPEEYAKVAEKAENGDRESIEILHQYFSNFPHTDLRNLEYWSEKLSKTNGRDAYTNLIVALASHNECDKSWDILQKVYGDANEFPFYKKNEREEYIDERCMRTF